MFSLVRSIPRNSVAFTTANLTGHSLISIPLLTGNGKTASMIDPRFVFLGAVLSIAGAAIYVRDTWRGNTAPNRVTWMLWGVEPLLAFAVQRQAHVGLASIMTLVLGSVPIVVVAVSFHDPASVWRVGRFDVVCGVVSVCGLIVWVAVHQATVGLVSFVVADAMAAIPTLRKSFIEPSTESSWSFLSAVVFAGITLLTLKHVTTAGALFPFSVLVMNIFIWIFIVSELGPKLRVRSTGKEMVP